MVLQSGKYLIINAYSLNVAALPFGKQGDPVVTHVPGLYEGITGKEWNIVQLGNGNYKIQNVGLPFYFAGCSFRPTESEYVLSKFQPREWVIKPTKSSNKYIISPSSNRDLVWGMPEREHGTPICMSSVATDRRNQWTFEPVNNPKHTYPPDGQVPTDRRACYRLPDCTETSRFLQDEEQMVHSNAVEDPLIREDVETRRGFDVKSFLKAHLCWW